MEYAERRSSGSSSSSNSCVSPSEANRVAMDRDAGDESKIGATAVLERQKDDKQGSDQRQMAHFGRNKREKSIAEKGEHQKRKRSTSSTESAIAEEKAQKRRAKTTKKHPASTVLQQKWNRMFERLLAFKSEHGHCLVPNRFAEDPGKYCQPAYALEVDRNSLHSSSALGDRKSVV